VDFAAAFSIAQAAKEYPARPKTSQITPTGLVSRPVRETLGPDTFMQGTATFPS